MCIGILGGMGPAASAESYRQLVRVCQQRYHAVEDDDFPPMIIHSIPLKGFNGMGFADGDGITKQLIRNLQNLEAAGATIIIIDCNTVHLLYDQFVGAVASTVIHLVDVTVNAIVEKGITKVGVLASDTSRRLGLYDKALWWKGIQTIHTTDAEQEVVNRLIHRVMGDTTTSADRYELQAICERLFEDGAEAVIMGCTEISAIMRERIDGKHYIDSQWLAIQEAVKRYYDQSAPAHLSR